MAGPTLCEMADAVDGLTVTHRNQLRGLEELSYRHGFAPGRDMDLGGLRIAVARAEVAALLLRRLVPHEAAVMALLGGQSEKAPATPAAV